MSVRRPQIELMQPYEAKAVVCIDRFLDIEGRAHANTTIRLKHVLTNTLITDVTVGSPVRNYTITGLSLTPGDLYLVRAKYQADSDWSAWGPNFTARVPKDLDYSEITVSAEPASGGVCPVTPSFPLPVKRSRPFTEWTMETGHPVRRPVHTSERRWVTLRWDNIETADKVTLEAFLLARMDAAESFTVNDERTDASRKWFPRRGAYKSTMDSVGTWSVALEADEVF